MIQAGHDHDEGLAPSEQHTKSIQIYQDRIDIQTQEQVKWFYFNLFSFKITSENKARALICLVYENDRCLLHVGLIKIVSIESLLKLPTGHSHHREKFISRKSLFEI